MTRQCCRLASLLLPFLLLVARASRAQTPPVAPSAAQPATRYVATNGNDAWSGTLAAPNRRKTDGPFATFDRALQAVAAIPASGKGSRVLEIRGGTYALDKSLTLRASVSGLTIRAYHGEAVRIEGGRAVGDWRPITDAAVLARLDPAVRGKVVQTDLRAQGVTDFGHLTARGFGRPDAPAPLELFANDMPMTLARWPNVGATLGAPEGNGEWAVIAGTPGGQNGGRFTYVGDRPSRWKASDEIWLHGYWSFDWADTYERVAAIDPAKREIATAPPHGAFGYLPGKRWYALNVLEELDAPGEYYVDHASGMLYFYPPTPPGKNDRAVVSTLDAPLIDVVQAANITVRGLAVEDGRGDGIHVFQSDNVTVEYCTVRNMGESGIEVSGGVNCRVADCRLYGLGDRGVSVSGGDRATLASCRHEVENCDIHDYSRWDKTYRAGVNVDGVGIRVRHCHIYNAPHNAILLAGNDNIVERNEIDRVCEETGDAGAFYMGRDWTMRGNVVRDNWFHDLSGVKNQSGFTDVMAVYLDDCASGTLVTGNIFERIHGRAIMVGGGRDDKVRGNLFVDCQIAVHVDARAQGWAKKYADPGGEWKMQEKLAALHYDQSPYSVRYPELAAMKTDDDSFPRGTEVVDNVIAETPPLDVRWLVLQDKLDATKIPIAGNRVVGMDAVTTAPGRPALLRRAAAGVGSQFAGPPDSPMGLLPGK